MSTYKHTVLTYEYTYTKYISYIHNTSKDFTSPSQLFLVARIGNACLQLTPGYSILTDIRISTHYRITYTLIYRLIYKLVEFFPSFLETSFVGMNVYLSAHSQTLSK